MYKNILVQVLCNTGDVVLSTGAIALLKKAYPKAKITVMVRPVSQEIVKNHPMIDEVLLAEYKSKQWSFAGMLSLVSEIRRRNFDVAICLDAKQRSALLVFLAGIPVRVAADSIFKRLSSWRRKMFTHIISPDCNVNNSHQSEIFQSIIRQFTNTTDIVKLEMGKPKTENENKVAQLLEKLPTHKKRIALCVKGTFALKDWPKERFIELIEKLQNYSPDAAFYIVGAPSDREYAQKIIDATSVSVANFCGKTTLVDLKELLEQSSLFVTVDTGAVHIASTTDVPIVALYGCTSPVRWHPLNANYAVLYAGVLCSPCSVPENACPEQHACMRSISVENVLKAIMDLGCLELEA